MPIPDARRPKANRDRHQGSGIHHELGGLSLILEVITTSTNCVFILGLSNTALSLWEVDLTMKEFVECEEFRIIGEESFFVRCDGAYLNLLLFERPTVDFIDPLIVQRSN